MFESLLRNSLDQIEVVEALIETHDEFIAKQVTDRQVLFKAYAVASCVTRLYAIYEHFVESIVGDFLDAVPELIPFVSLPAALRNEYRLGISRVLSKIDGERYGHLKHENVILWYHEALTNGLVYKFVTEALVHHDQNLRLNVVEHLFSRVDMSDLRGWLARSPEIHALYQEQSSTVEQLDAELGTFIQTRNDAAHGVLEVLEGKELLLRHCELVRALIGAIAAYIHNCLLIKRTTSGRMRRAGQVTEVFVQAGAFVATIDEGVELKQGMPIHLVGHGYCAEQRIESLQVNDISLENVVATSDCFEVGIKCALNTRKNAEMFIDCAVL